MTECMSVCLCVLDRYGMFGGDVSTFSAVALSAGVVAFVFALAAWAHNSTERKGRPGSVMSFQIYAYWSARQYI